MKSSHSTSPGCTGANLLDFFIVFPLCSVIIDDFNTLGIPVFSPFKTNPPLLVDANAVLPFSVALQQLQSIGRRRFQIIQAPCSMQVLELAPRRLLNVMRQRMRPYSPENLLGFPASKARNHRITIIVTR